MIEKLCYFYLVYECLFSILLGVGSLLSECFDCDPLLVLETDSQVDGCEVTFAQSFFSLEQIMKIVLIHQMFAL